MEPNVKEKTEALAKALAESETYKNLVAAREEIEKHEAAKIMVRDLGQKLGRLQEKLLRGEQPSEEETADYQQTAALVTMNPYVRRLLDAEMAFAEMMAAVQMELARAVGLEEPDQLLEASESARSVQAAPKSRLWVPGRD